MKGIRVFFLAAVLTSPAYVFAQNVVTTAVHGSQAVNSQNLPIETETYGTSAQIKLQIPGSALVPIDPNTFLAQDNTAQFYNGGTNTVGRLVAGVNLPSGAKIEGMELFYDDTDPNFNVEAVLFTTEGTTTNT